MWGGWEHRNCLPGFIDVVLIIVIIWLCSKRRNGVLRDLNRAIIGIEREPSVNCPIEEAECNIESLDFLSVFITLSAFGVLS
ncbi:MAG: hypothetical protein WBI96_05775 [Candidatus Hydrothermia bacterium]